MKKLAVHCFKDCDVIIHAGDLVDIAVLDIFSGKKIYAVHGNMCNSKTANTLPGQTTFQLEQFTVGLVHGAGLGFDIELRLWDLFPEADCMIYGHTHRAVCHRQGKALIINPGSFQKPSPYGGGGTYAILEIDNSMHGAIYEVPYLR